jgi:hypothetical protein
MKIMIADAHRVSNVGRYNRLVTECVECGGRLSFKEHCIGFNYAPYPSRYYADVDIYALVFECPSCHTIQWMHGDEQSYEQFIALKAQ